MAETLKNFAVVFGAGPAGLAAGYELTKNKKKVLILEKDSQVGGISKTINYKNYYFDIGGHRFFTKNKEVQDIWKVTLGDDFLKRPRLSRIYYDKKFYFYPLRPMNALKNIGIMRAIAIVVSYAIARTKYFFGPKKKLTTFEEWVVARFGRKLFTIFFKTYTEKIWGISTTEIGAEWASQRIKGLSLARAIVNAFFPNNAKETSLIDEFHYPKYGPGMMYEKMAENIRSKNGEIKLGCSADRIHIKDMRVQSIETRNNDGSTALVEGDNFISSIPLPELIQKINPPPPENILKALQYLRFRGFFTVCLIIDSPDIFPDTWIYIHSPEVKVCRIQNFKNWSPFMVPDTSKTSLGMEYVCFEGDDLWKMDDEKLIEFAKDELHRVGLGGNLKILDGFVARQKDTYPIYKIGYRAPLEIIFEYIKSIKNLQIVGRGGTFRYNNMDHSIVTGLYAARNVLGGRYDVLNVNIDEEYQEINNKKL